MTQEERRLYQRAWRERNKDKVKEQERRCARKKAMSAVQDIKRLNERVCIVTDVTGCEYVICK